VKWDTVTACNNVLEHLIEKRNSSPTCELCGVVGFDMHGYLFNYLFSLEVKQKIHRTIYDTIYKFVYEHYPYNDYSVLARHHVNYKKGICIIVCSSCHSKIHNSPDPKYQEYKPVDKRPKDLNEIKYNVYKRL